MNVEIQLRRTLGQDLRKALDRNELHIVYQPRVSLENGGIIALEALMRWQHPARGAVPPVAFPWPRPRA